MKIKHKILPLIIALLFGSQLGCSGGSSVQVTTSIDSFLTNPSDQFLVDIEYIARGHPFIGTNANIPHSGAHLHLENRNNEWPQGDDIPENYIPIYAVADGLVVDVTTYFEVGENYRYGVSLAIGQNADGQLIKFNYSIEPMINPVDSTFYEKYIFVSVGDEVKKGDIIAFFYIAPGEEGGAHIHFNVTNDSTGQFLAPAIFNSSVVEAFHSKWNEFGFDGDDEMPVCMGYKLIGEENLFSAVDVDCL